MSHHPIQRFGLSDCLENVGRRNRLDEMKRRIDASGSRSHHNAKPSPKRAAPLSWTSSAARNPSRASAQRPAASASSAATSRASDSDPVIPRVSALDNDLVHASSLRDGVLVRQGRVQRIGKQKTKELE